MLTDEPDNPSCHSSGPPGVMYKHPMYDIIKSTDGILNADTK